MTHRVVAIDLGGTNVRAALVDPDGSIIHRDRRPTPSGDAQPDVLVEMVRAMAALAAEDGSPVDRAVVGLPGVVDHVAEVLVAAPNLPQAWLPFLTDAWLTEQTGLAVSLANDADLAAVGEANFGAGKPHRDVVYVTISTGVGAGIVLGDLLMRGRYSGGEIGHTIVDRSLALAGNDGTVEGLGSGTAIGQSMKLLGFEPGGTAITDAVRSGDPRATAVFDQAMQSVGIGIVNLCWLFSPQMIVVGGGVGMNGDLVLPTLRRVVAELGPEIAEIEIVNAGLADDAALAGAAAWWGAIGRSD